MTDAYAIRRLRPDDREVLRAVRLNALLDSPAAFCSTHAEQVAFTDQV